MVTNNNDDNDNDDDDADGIEAISIAVVTTSLQKYVYDSLNSLTMKSIHILKWREGENRGRPSAEVFKGSVSLFHLRVVLRLAVM